MQLARVIGTVVSTQKHPGLNGYKLLLVQPVDRKLQQLGGLLVAVDVVGAGVGEVVLIAVGSQARMALRTDGPSPIDAAIIGIVDQVEVNE